MIISIIVAAASNNVIGKDNRLIWRMPEDMKFFKEKTEGHFVLTGRKNYESIPEKFRPLPKRENIVVTHRSDYPAPGALVVHSIEAGIQLAKQRGERELFIIGGAEIYRQCIEIADVLYLTRIHHNFDGDALFPEIGEHWKLVDSKACLKDERHEWDYTFETYKRKKQ